MLRSLHKTILTLSIPQKQPQNSTKTHQFLLPFANYLSSQSSPTTEPDPHQINDLCRILSDFRSPHHDIESALHPFSSIISPNFVEQVLKRCNNLGFSAHRFFVWAQNLPGFEHTKESFHILVDILGRTKQFPLLWAFLGETKRSGVFEIESKIFWLVMIAYSRADLPSDAIRAYNKMLDFGLKHDINDLNQLLFTLCKRGRNVKLAQEFFDKVKNDFAPDAKSYNILMSGWGKIGESDEARKLFGEMGERGMSLDLITYNSLLACLCKGGKVDDAYKLFTEMKSMGLKPDAYTLSIFIHAACDANDLHTTFRILDRMKRYKLVPNVFTYNKIIKTLCRSGLFHDAYMILDQMIDHGMTPDTWSYNTIIAYHAEHTEINRALKMISRMDRESCKPDRHTYNIVLKLLIREGRIDRVQEVWDSMEKRGFYPGVSTYAVMVHGFCKKREKAKEASEYFEMMIEEGLPPYTSTCRLLKQVLIRAKRSSQVDILAEKMERSTSCTIQELSKVMRRDNTHVESRNKEPSYRKDYRETSGEWRNEPSYQNDYSETYVESRNEEPSYQNDYSETYIESRTEEPSYRNNYSETSVVSRTEEPSYRIDYSD